MVADWYDRACVANVVRLVENYKFNGEDVTYKVEIIELWAYEIHIPAAQCLKS